MHRKMNNAKKPNSKAKSYAECQPFAEGDKKL